MSSLYELTSEYMEVLEMAEDPDMDQQTIIDTLEGIGGEIEDKADAYAKVMKTLDAEAKAIKEEITRLTMRKASLESNSKRIKDSLQQSMILTGKTKFKTTLFSFGIQKNGGKAPLVYDDSFNPFFLDDDLKKVTVEPNADKIREALAAGRTVDGVSIGERGESLRIR